MATSQFTIYSSSDPSGPGPITGLTGSLITVLDACLVNGYPGKAAAGWTKQTANVTGSAAGSLSIIAAYKIVSGSQMTLVVNDSGAGNGGAGGTECAAAGWESLTGLTASNYVMTSSGSNSVGVGFGQFPLPTQLFLGNVQWRKSSTADNTPRYWIMFADSCSMYLFIQTGDATSYQYGNYFGMSFGDIYSFRGSSDLYRCLLIGRATRAQPHIGPINAAGGTALYDGFDGMPIYSTGNSGNTIAVSTRPFLAQSSVGHYMPRTWGGGGSSISAVKVGDIGKISGTNSALAGGTYQLCWWPFGGILQTPNSADNSLYLSPIQIGEQATISLRGRWRGIYQVCHPIGNFSDGQTFAGAGDYAGKTFQIVKTCQLGGFFAIETSPTVETN